MTPDGDMYYEGGAHGSFYCIGKVKLGINRNETIASA